MTVLGRRSRLFTALIGVAGTVALGGAPHAAAKPTCTDINPTTMVCRSPGHARISTSPPAQPSGPQYGWPLGGVVIGFL
ncbi:hypothetical protein [Mycolicibacterium thermoresistibile]